jgi:predicted RNA-binding Zn ribbon-like protein
LKLCYRVKNEPPYAVIRTLENLELDGGCFVFDFINTVNTRKPTPEFEYLNTFEDFLAWSTKVGLLREKRLKTLRKLALVKRKLAAEELCNAIDVRENFYRLFSAIAAGKSPDAAVVNAFNERLSLAFQKIHMRINAATAEPRFNNDVVSLDEPLNSIFKSAFDILTGEDFQRIKECPRCGWLFLDTSKNGKRRWCNMNVCGSREKSLDYYYRKTKTS